MAIPIIGEIWDGIRWIIDFFFSKAPTPIIIMIFLMFLMLLDPLTSLMFNLAGFHCNSDNEVMKLSALQIGANVQLLIQAQEEVITGEELNFSEVHPDKQPSECYFYARETSEINHYETCYNVSDTTNCTYLYDLGSCFNCTNDDIYFEKTAFFFVSEWKDVCLDDAYPPPPSDNFADGLTCNHGCDIPNNYKFDHETGTYKCTDLSECGNNATPTDTQKDQILRNNGAEPLYETKGVNEDYTGVITMQCDNSNRARMTFFGIDLFSYKIWLFLIVIGAMFTMLYKLQTMNFSRK